MQGHQSCDELDQAESLEAGAIDQDLYGESDIQACQTPGFLHEWRGLRRAPVMYRNTERGVGPQRSDVCSQYR
jgi:hypothetical protein